MIINWNLESMDAEAKYRRERLHRLADHRAVPGAHALPHQDRDPVSWWKRLRSGG